MLLLVWFKRDLWVVDHPALALAAAQVMRKHGSRKKRTGHATRKPQTTQMTPDI